MSSAPPKLGPLEAFLELKAWVWALVGTPAQGPGADEVAGPASWEPGAAYPLWLPAH